MAILLVFLSWLIPFIFTLKVLISGSIPFWFDPARDLILAQDNLHKLTLMGPSSGIPGVFYGPYWIWLLSVGRFFSANPRIIIFIALTIPYFVLFPLLLFRLRKVLGGAVAILLWLLFILNFGGFATQIWNPHLSPLLFLLLVTVLMDKEKKYTHFLLGFIVGLILNFHIAFGIGVLLGTLIFLLLSSKKKLPALVLFCFGCGVIFLPSLFFEARHGFNQIHAVINTLMSKGAVVSQTGLSKTEILLGFFVRFNEAVGIQSYITGLTVLVAGFVLFFLSLKQKGIHIEKDEKKLFQFLLLCLLGIFTVYVSSKNPVWKYHFVGVEIILSLLIGLVINKVSLLKVVLSIWVLFVLGLNSVAFIKGLIKPSDKTVSLANEQRVVETILADAGKKPYTVFIYNPAIYTYDYSYLFGWLGKKDVPWDPGRVVFNTDIAYLIFPPGMTQEARDGYVNYRTSNEFFETKKTWMGNDETVFLKRVKSSFAN